VARECVHFPESRTRDLWVCHTVPQFLQELRTVTTWVVLHYSLDSVALLLRDAFISKTIALFLSISRKI
jgi:hypothetical protein